MVKAFEVSAALFVRGLANLKGMLQKGEAHAIATGKEPGSLLGARLAEDMYDLAIQAHWACEGAKLAIGRLLDVPSTPRSEEARTFDGIYERLDDAIAHLAKVDPEALEAGLARTIELRHRGDSKTFRGDRFLTEYAIPNFYFHFAAAYGILRHEGVPLQKGDFMGS